MEILAKYYIIEILAKYYIIEILAKYYIMCPSLCRVYIPDI